MPNASMGTGRPLALITGASSGIGATFARQLAVKGYDLVLVARRKQLLDELAKEIEDLHGVRAEALAADLTEESGLRLVEQRIVSAANLEVLVNNAGFGVLGRFFDIPVEGQDQMHRLHVLATMRLARAALGGMVGRGKGGIVNVSSVASFWQSPGNVSYCATKLWMNSFTEGLSLELRSVGSPVKVQALCPGFTMSEFHDVMGVDRATVPSGWWLTAEEVVMASLDGLERGALYVVPGRRYKLIVALMKGMPRALRHAIAIRMARRLRRDQAR